MLEKCEDEEKRRELERMIRDHEEEIERLKQELETTATDDGSDRDAEEGSVNLLSTVILSMDGQGIYLQHRCMGYNREFCSSSSSITITQKTKTGKDMKFCRNVHIDNHMYSVILFCL